VKRRNLLLIVALMVGSGFIGGMVAHATQLTRTLVAEEFRLVDQDGNLCGRLYVDDEGRGQIELLPQGRKLDGGS